VVPHNPNLQNDWTLDTNVLITANGRKSSSQSSTVIPQPENQILQIPQTNRQIARALLNCIRDRGRFCWSAATVQEYIARGALHLGTPGPPPVPVQNQQSMTWFDLWLTQPAAQNCIYYPKIQALTGGEKAKLGKAKFRDHADFAFLELARSSRSKRLVTRESHYNNQTIKAIKRILHVICLEYQSALEECDQVTTTPVPDVFI
jgi:hypothetical protein